MKWTRKTTAAIAAELTALGIKVSANTVGKLLRELGYSLKVNCKKRSNSPTSPKDRDEQFQLIATTRERFEQQGLPIISVDTKKRELVGAFKNPGQAWTREAVSVNDHDFRSLANGVAIPYGIYDVGANLGTVFVGTSKDTADFATDCLCSWWRLYGRWRYEGAKELLILADSGGSNDPRRRAWIYGLQSKMADRYGLTVTATHYPPGCSKWNPIDHRLFSEISKNWAGRPLDSYQTILNYIQSTTTKTGLKVSAHLNETVYDTGVKISDEQWTELHIERHELQPNRNYTLKPALQLVNSNSEHARRASRSHHNAPAKNPELVFA